MNDGSTFKSYFLVFLMVNLSTSAKRTFFFMANDIAMSTALNGNTVKTIHIIVLKITFYLESEL